MKLEAIQTEQLAEIVRICPWPVLVCDENQRIQYLNQATCDLLEVQKDSLVGCVAGELLKGLQPAFESQLAGVEVTVGSRSLKLNLESQLRFFSVGQSRWSVLFLRDAQERSQREMVLEQQATTDELSGLANRRGFQRRLEANLSGKLSLAIIDIDHFKAINDQKGHVVGDDVIGEVGRQIAQLFDDFCIVAARMGGDEFGVLCHSTDAEKMLEQLKALQTGIAGFRLDAHTTISIGAVVSSVAGLPPS